MARGPLIVKNPRICDVCSGIVVAGQCTNKTCGAKATPPPQEPPKPDKR